MSYQELADFKATFSNEGENSYKLRLLTVFCFIMMGLIAVTVAFSVILSAIKGSGLSFSTLTNFIALLLFLLTYYIARKGYLRLGSWLLILNILLDVTISIFSLGSGADIVIIGFFYPIGLALALLTTMETIIITGFCILISAMLYIVQNVWKIYNPATLMTEDSLATTGLFIVILVIPTIVALLVLPIRAQTNLLKKQNARLITALEEIRRSQKASLAVSNQVQQMAGELKANATQQTAGSRQQVSTITEITASVRELAVTAENITALASDVSDAVNTMADGSGLIEQTTALTATQSEKGITAVQHTAQVSQEVAEIYQSQLDLFNQLNAKNANMRRILQLLQSISDETHLLALNAAVEAAGAGEFGERFRVVAQEVKSLAARSSQANKEVVSIVKEIGAATQEAKYSVESGYQKAQEMTHISQEAGAVIAEMQRVSEQAKQQAATINNATQEVKDLIDIIKAATNQQQSASEQVLEALSSLTLVAQETASGSNIVSVTATDLEKVSLGLNAA